MTPTSPLVRLRRLPWRLTAVLTAVAAVGVAVLAAFLIKVDTERGDAVLDGELGQVTAAVSRLISYDGTIDTTLVTNDQFNKACPEFAVLPGPTDPFPEHISELDCADIDLGVERQLASRAVAGGHELHGDISDGQGRRFRVRVEPFRSAKGQYIGAVVAVADPSDVRAAHRRFVLLVLGGCVLFLGAVAAVTQVLTVRALRPAAAALEQQEVLLADTAHDLRTPVAALRALAETALQHPGQRAELLPRAVELSVRMGDVIDGVLTRARLAAGVESLEIQPVWLDQLVGAVVDDTDAGDARVTVTAAPTKALADPALMRRAIGNLLDNALRHGRRPGRPAVVHITVAGGRVTVADHGPGVDAALAEQNFERFTSSGASSGLGLSIVRWVCQAHGGTLRVYNAEEGGAIFELELPVDKS